MDHKWFEHLIALADEKSFSKATKLGHVTQRQCLSFINIETLRMKSVVTRAIASGFVS